MRYAIQLRTNGSVLDYSDSLEEIQQIMASSSHNLENCGHNYSLCNKSLHIQS